MSEHYVQLDSKWPTYESDFNIPTFKSLDIPTDQDVNKKVIYLCGNSLGLMPKQTRTYINDELDAWSDRAVESHFRHPGANSVDGKTSWVDIDLPVIPLLTPMVGALESEVAIMGSLTANLNSLLTAFYQPKGKKTKILFEKGSFPSDYYSFYNQIKLKQAYNDSASAITIEEQLIQLAPRDGDTYLRTEDILQAIEDSKDELSIVLLPGIQFYTGQFFDIATITKFAQERGILCGWDLAHAVGNVPLKLHEWGVDFATWCSYKYLNSGPGGISGIFIHEKHNDITSDFKPRLAGWWGNNSEKRFQMLEKFEPIQGALGFRQSNPSVIDVVSVKSSLDLIHSKGGIERLRAKSLALTGYLWSLLTASEYYIQSTTNVNEHKFTILTPEDPEQRGAQLSVLFFPRTSEDHEGVMEKINEYLKKHGVICDERRPDVIRFAPVPLYNTFEDVFHSVRLLEAAFESLELE